jgi:hypothetical protein
MECLVPDGNTICEVLESLGSGVYVEEVGYYRVSPKGLYLALAFPNAAHSASCPP